MTLAAEHRMLVVIDLVVELVQKARLLIGGADLADILQRLLNAVRHADARRLGDFGMAPGQLPAAEQQRERHRNAPKAGQRQLPVVGEEHDGDERRGDVRPVEITEAVRPDVLQPVHVAHDRLGQIGQIALAEIAQRQLAQAFGK